MDDASLQLMRRPLRPLTFDEISAVVRARIGALSGGERLYELTLDLKTRFAKPSHTEVAQKGR